MSIVSPPPLPGRDRPTKPGAPNPDGNSPSSPSPGAPTQEGDPALVPVDRTGELSVIRRAMPRRGDLPVLSRVRSSKPIRTAAYVLMGLLIATVVLMAFASWQQTVRGTGRVMNYDPAVRPQMLQAPISGRVLKLGENVREMATVAKGELIAEMVDLDAERLGRLELQLANAERTTQDAKEALTAAEGELRQAESAVEQYRANIATYEAVREQTLAAAGAYVAASRKNLVAAERTLDDRRATLQQAEADYKRQKKLFDEKLSSQLKFQTAEQKYRSAEAAVRKAEADVEAATQEVEAKSLDRETKGESALTAVRKAEVDVRDAEAKIEARRAGVARARQSVQSAENAEQTLRSTVSRQQNQRIVAPFDGVLTEVYADGGSNVLSPGAPIARIVPTSGDRVVEVVLDGNDAPLVSPGAHVRLQFEGWPAIQFSGWPSVAVGTFGGEVLSVDAADNGQGQFRILVKEVSGIDTMSGLEEQPWPQGNWLRPGVRANAWVLLETVPLWWEVWRNLNGFPPVVDTGEAFKRPKVPKLPK